MIETIYIARHVRVSKIILFTWRRTSPTGLPRDPPLAAFGETQAQELADYFLNIPEDQRPTVILSSPYYRCLQTAQPTALALHVPIFVEHGLSEWYSHVQNDTGLHPRPSSAESLKEHFPDAIDPAGWSSIYYPPRTGEDVAEVHARGKDFLAAFVPFVERALSEEKHKRVLLVSHAATVIVLARALSGNPEMPLRIGCATVTEFVRETADKNPLAGWKSIRFADAAHLKDGSQRDWGFEDIEVADGQVVDDPGVPGTQGQVELTNGVQLHAIVGGSANL